MVVDICAGRAGIFDVIWIWERGQGGDVSNLDALGHRGPVSSRPEMNCEDADASMVTERPVAVRHGP
jgi:hypothetical protein